MMIKNQISINPWNEMQDKKIMNTIQEQWEIFKDKVIPKDSSETQISEMKKAFYGGAWTSLITLSATSSNPNISEDAKVEIMEGLFQECELFSRGLLEKNLTVTCPKCNVVFGLSANGYTVCPNPGCDFFIIGNGK